jgi:hypothetical protein
MLKLGQTSKVTLLDTFGPPFAIMKPAEVVTVQALNRFEAGQPAASVGNYETVDTDAVFALFTEGHEIGFEHRIYYYYFGISWRIGIVGPFVVQEISDIETQRLWALVNERTAIVEDFAYRTTF